MIILVYWLKFLNNPTKWNGCLVVCKEMQLWYVCNCFSAVFLRLVCCLSTARSVSPPLRTAPTVLQQPRKCTRMIASFTHHLVENSARKQELSVSTLVSHWRGCVEYGIFKLPVNTAVLWQLFKGHVYRYILLIRLYSHCDLHHLLWREHSIYIQHWIHLPQNCPCASFLQGQ